MEERYTTGEFSKRTLVPIKTLQMWDRKGTLKAKRTITTRRYYTDEDIEKVRKGR